jgi:hypothetical protein
LGTDKEKETIKRTFFAPKYGKNTDFIGHNKE